MLRVLALALALLFAQQAALAHAITHQGPACELHAAMGAVCGALDAAPHAAFTVDALPERPRARPLRLASLSAPTPSCRGPPPVSPS